jgi:hypothetical protein
VPKGEPVQGLLAHIASLSQGERLGSLCVDWTRSGPDAMANDVPGGS